MRTSSGTWDRPVRVGGEPHGGGVSPQALQGVGEPVIQTAGVLAHSLDVNVHTVLRPPADLR